jgi:hypothetical protein
VILVTGRLREQYATLEPNGMAPACNAVEVGSPPPSVSSEAIMRSGHLRPATGGVEDSRPSGHWATAEESVPPPARERAGGSIRSESLLQ